nr:hypothetical protein Iba_chr05cCG18620 [Ipomoea batatas]GMC98688.1 hypothetical protein Iba_chr05dCG18680 [Ipomoea batatas]GMD02398.1 hypothetical protein Iba_chr05fCG16240 [Ipomoea batatas]GMD20468.1 hypothetical protein Iba_chr07fCG5160 [Ipomoea batatas]GME09668.1 hypothetical protein Iba_scaffold8947CG0380 [Ipomoea batatas]
MKNNTKINRKHMNRMCKIDKCMCSVVRTLISLLPKKMELERKKQSAIGETSSATARVSDPEHKVDDRLENSPTENAGAQGRVALIPSFSLLSLSETISVYYYFCCA